MTRARVVVVDHHDSYTWNLVHLVASVTGTLPVVVEHDEVVAEQVLDAGFSHIVLSPGPGSPHNVVDFSVGHVVLRESDVPVLGVCLGMQGLVAAYGGQVSPVAPAHGDVAQVSHTGSGLFRGVPQPFQAVRYHSLAAVALPVVLEETAWCDDATTSGAGPPERVVMGVAHREKPLWGVQFHPESVLTEHGSTLVANFLELA